MLSYNDPHDRGQKKPFKINSTPKAPLITVHRITSYFKDEEITSLVRSHRFISVVISVAIVNFAVTNRITGRKPRGFEKTW